MDCKICHISTVHPALDDRIFYKECSSLAEAGYEVMYIVQHPRDEKIGNVNILALSEFKNRFVRFFKGNFLAIKLCLWTGARLCHFHDPELMPAGVILRILGKKVVYDVHEDLPGQALYKEWIRSGLIRMLASGLILVAEKISCLFFNGIAAATQDIQKKYPPRKTILLRNFPVTALIERSRPFSFPDKKFRLVYAGGLTKIRGIREIIDAVGLLHGKVELILIGKFSDDGFFDQCRLSTGWRYVNYIGHIKHEDVFGYVAACDAAIAMLYPVKNYLTSLPVKAFEYMALRKPMILSGFPFWKETFANCAIFADPYNPEDIAESITRLAENRVLAAELGQNGKRAVEQGFSWEREEKELLNLYQRILKDADQTDQR
ncbi:MAG: glycosyltransferase family 4 protein [Bacteroidales bacterium]|nr:glycosyltransferase family 4 protein [Bacteroidales bacterium]